MEEAPWWVSEFEFTHENYQKAVEESERSKRAKIFRNTVALAKREHWKRSIEDMKSSIDAYRLIQEAAPQHSNITPSSPLRHEARFIADQSKRAIILRLSNIVFLGI